MDGAEKYDGTCLRVWIEKRMGKRIAPDNVSELDLNCGVSGCKKHQVITLNQGRMSLFSGSGVCYHSPKKA